MCSRADLLRYYIWLRPYYRVSERYPIRGVTQESRLRKEPGGPLFCFRADTMKASATARRHWGAGRSRQCPDGEIGRRSGLKIRRPQGRGGSSPPPGTNQYAPLSVSKLKSTQLRKTAGGCSGGCWFTPCCMAWAIYKTVYNDHQDLAGRLRDVVNEKNRLKVDLAETDGSIKTLTEGT